MFDRLKFLTSALLGLLLGILIAIPLFWFGVKKNVEALKQGCELSFAQVEKRQQAMSDEALRLEKKLSSLGWNKHKKDFVKVEVLRSELAGSADLVDKLEISQQLERALLGIEKIYEGLGKDAPEIEKNPFVRDFGLNWGPLKRYLVDEEMNCAARIHGYDAVLKSWPIPMVIGYRSFASLVNAMVVAVRDKALFYLRQAWAWVKWGFEWAYDKVRGLPLPEIPRPLPVVAPEADPLFAPLEEPYYIAEAPKPEEDYAEIQYRRPYPNMADVEVGEDPAVLENKYSKPYVAPVPTVQKTATY